MVTPEMDIAATWLCNQTHLPSFEEVEFTDQVRKDKITPVTLPEYGRVEAAAFKFN